VAAQPQPAPGPAQDVALLLAVLRTARGWRQDTLANASGIRHSAVSDYERGRKLPELATLRRLLGPMGYTLASLDVTRGYLAALQLGAEGGSPVPPPVPVLPGLAPAALDLPQLLWEIEQAAAQFGAATGRLARAVLLLLLRRRGRDRGDTDALKGHRPRVDDPGNGHR
jgi:transcriptional regulator with XRE-family HTH domain